MTLWNEIVIKGKENQSHPEINVLDKDDITTIIATLDFFGASKNVIQQFYSDLIHKGPFSPKFRFFDCLAMMVNTVNRRANVHDKQAIKVLVYAFRAAGYDEKKFIENLRVNDYDIDRGWESIELS